MKTILRIPSILRILTIFIFMAACQPLPTATSEPVAPTKTAELSALVTEPEVTPASLEPESTGPTVQFFEQFDTFEVTPQIWLFGKPIENIPFAISINCDGDDSDIWATSDGVLINNHCIVDNYAPAYLVLSDGSVIGMGTSSRIQVNSAQDIITEVILEEGEIYNLVAPQGVSRRYTVLVGGMGIEAQGTRFAVKLKDKMIQVVVFDGKVITHRCLNWAVHTCMKWDQVSVELLPGYFYSNTVGEIDWTKGNLYNPDNLVPDPTFPVSWHLEPLLGDSVIYQDGSEYSIYWDQDNVNIARAHLQEYITSLISDIDEYDTSAAVMNFVKSDFCAKWSFDCPMATPMLPNDNPFAPVQDGGNPSGSSGGATCKDCPEFDASSCFARGGHTWCFPVAGSVDPAFSAEWDVTAICNSYPGESICSQIR